jgi:hydroxymethylbilane synthase
MSTLLISWELKVESMTKKTLKIGTRGSALALIQSRWVKAQLEKTHPQLEIQLNIIHTKGDKILDTALSKIGDKGLFTKEIETQLLAGTIDLAVHSLKDMPTRQPDGLTIAAITKREDPADAFVSKNGISFVELPRGAKILSGSLRRRSQLLFRRPDLEVVDVRGNIQTRLRKLDEGDAQAIVMAAAGLKRADLENRITENFDPTDFLPAPGQGALAIETRADDTATADLVSLLEDKASRIITTAERTLLAHLEGGCQIPIGAFAWQENDRLHLKAMVADLDGKQVLYKEANDALHQPEALGVQVAQQLLAAGGKEILADISTNQKNEL